ncbi:MAG: hypothetical protein HY319_06120 [Armatimonadetes bacterium]|nr:hypothetical protein [Armatimonadota bacterium]
MPRVLGALALAVLLITAEVAAAGPSFAAYDLRVSKLLWRQVDLLGKSAQILEEWSRGRLSDESATAALRRFLAAAGEVEKEVGGLRPPSGGEPLQKAAEQAAHVRVALIRRSVEFLSAGDPRQSAIKSFLLENVASNSEAQSRWLEARLKLVPRALGQKPAAGLRHYYEWQAALLPIQLDQVRIAARLQRLLLEDGDRDTMSRSAAEATRSGIAVRQRAEAVRPSKALQEPHRRALEEQIALARLCEAIQLYSEDRSPESVTRIRRAVRTLSDRSREAEEGSIQSLAAALGAK